MNKKMFSFFLITLFVMIVPINVTAYEDDEVDDRYRESYEETEPNNTRNNANRTYKGFTPYCYSSIGAGDTDDYFIVDMKKDSFYCIEFDKERNKNISFEMIAPNGRVVCSTDNYDTAVFNRGHKIRRDNNNSDQVFQYTATMTGDYYFHFKSNSTKKLDYHFKINEGAKSDVIWMGPLPSSSFLGLRNEWEDGKWFDSNGRQTYGGILEWKCNDVGWWAEDTYGWYPVSQWQKIDGPWYYFDSRGYMASDEWIDGYYLSEEGTIKNSDSERGEWVKDNIGWYYDAGGIFVADEWLRIDEKWYFFGIDGYMVTNKYIDGYWIDEDGVCR